MGKNLPAKKYTKKEPTQRRLIFEMSGGTTSFIDIGMALSTINRRAYRAGLYYYVNSVEVYNNETGVVDLHTLPDTWVTKNAWTRGFKLWNKMNRLAGPPLTTGLTPKYHDFKVYMNETHFNNGTKNPFLAAFNNNSNVVSPDDWQYSEFVSADDDQDGTANADEFNVHMMGAHVGSPSNWDSIGLIKSYSESRSTVDDFEPTNITGSSGHSTDPLTNVFDFSSEEQMNDIIDNLATFNDQPPYDHDEYVGELEGHLAHVARIGTEEGIGRIGRASGFCVPFGLLCVDPFGVSTDYRLVLNLAVGTYHGVHAERA